MVMSPERLREIDGELDALAKNDDDLTGVFARARELRGSLGDLDEALAALGVEQPTTLHARPPRPAAPPPPRSELPPKKAPAPQVEDPFVDSEPPAAKSEPPVVSEPPRPKSELPARSAPPRGQSDIAGLSVDDLFADADPIHAPAPPPTGGLADLFADEQLADADGAGSLEDTLGTTGTAEDDLNPFAEPNDDELNPFAEPRDDELNPFVEPPAEPVNQFADIQGEHTNVAAVPPEPEAPPRDSGGEFELLVDEDILELDESAIEEIEDE